MPTTRNILNRKNDFISFNLTFKTLPHFITIKFRDTQKYRCKARCERTNVLTKGNNVNLRVITGQKSGHFIFFTKAYPSGSNSTYQWDDRLTWI